MEEDLIEGITTMIFNMDNLCSFVMKLCQIATKEEQSTFEIRI